jgi:uncharacterized repeat protein (TIGR03803 family)
MRKQLAAWIGGSVLVASGIASGQTFQALHHFSDAETSESVGKLVLSSNTIYGVAGGYVGGLPHYGSIFRVNSDGSGYAKVKQFATMYPSSLGGGIYTNAEGAVPMGGLVLGGNTLYGTADQGGKFGLGTVFSIKTDGSGFTVLKHFSGSDGSNPHVELALDGNALYGTTAGGGISNKGAIFRINTDGSNYGLLKSFNGSEGWGPLGGLTLSQGRLYGTTYRGGVPGFGTVYSINTNGTGFAVLKEFTGADGAYPRYNLIVSGGVIYGTTDGGGDGSKSLVYKLNTDGSGFAVLKTFPVPDPTSGTNNDGFVLRCGLASSGRTLFGATQQGGNFANGVVFALNIDGSNYTVLKHFSALPWRGTNSDGSLPFPSLMLGQATLYGTTEYGGNTGGGTLFSIGLAPRLETAFSSNGFAFNVTGYPNEKVVIETSAELGSPSWVPLQTNSVPVSFVDPNWRNYNQRFYRARLE